MKMVNKTLELLNPTGLNDPSQHGYTHIAIAPPGSKIVYISGQYGADSNGKLVSNDFTAQLKQTFANLRTALAAAGAHPEQIAKITVLIVEHNEENLKPLKFESDAMWGEHKPASILIPVPRLALDGMLVEIDATAVI